MRTLNVGVLAHVDAGKTSLTERLLFATGTVDHLGSVDAGTAQTDSMDLERRRGITIRTAVSSFTSGDTTINIVDTPGHPDFIAEVERALSVLDAAVLVLSAVEGVQPQTVVLWRALARLGVPTVVFINKIDRQNADVGDALTKFTERLCKSALPLSRVERQGCGDVAVRAVPLSDSSVIEQLADHDERILEHWVHGVSTPRTHLEHVFRSRLADGLVTPVLAGSAVTGAGVQDLLDILADMQPPAASEDEPASGMVFKVDRDAHGRHVFIRMRSGRLRVRDRLTMNGPRSERVTHLSICEDGALVPTRSVGPGQIAKVTGLTSARIGDHFGSDSASGGLEFPPPTAESIIHTDDGQGARLFAALTELADEDPLIRLRVEPTGEIAVSLYGEVQKEVLASMLLDRYSVETTFGATRTVCIERVLGEGSWTEQIQVGDNPYLATVGLRIEPAPVGTGIEFRLGVELGSMPPAFFTATEEAVRQTLQHGLYGWRVLDALVTMTASGYWARQSHAHQKFNKAFSTVAGDFRYLTPVVLIGALREARTQVCSPVHRFEMEVPSSSAPTVLAVLGRYQGVPHLTTSRGAYTRIEGFVPAESVRPLSHRLPDLTHGEGILTARPDHYEPVHGECREGTHAVPDPRCRDAWFRAVKR